MRLKSIALLTLLFIGNSLYCAPAAKKIAVLPFINNGSIVYEKLSDYIPSYIILLLKDLPGYAASPLQEIKKYMNLKSLGLNDLKNQAVLTSITTVLGSSLLIGGYYSDEGGKIFVSFTIYKPDGKSLSMDNKVVSLALDKTDIFTMNDSFDKLVPILEDITRVDLKPGVLTMTADHVCSLYVDGEEYGETPMRILLSAGKHGISLVHKGKGGDEKVLEEALEIKSGSSVSKNLTVFVPLSINAEEKCTVFINGEERGPTPFEEHLYTGREYLVNVVYYASDGSAIEVYKEVISTKKKLDPLYFTAKARLAINSPSPFLGSMGWEELKSLPWSFSDIVPGRYRTRVVLPDDQGNNGWVFFDDTITITPFSDISLDFDRFDYEKSIGLALVPAASQFYNREPVKGWIVLGAFLCAAAFTGVSIWQWAWNDSRYKDLWDDATNPPPGWIDDINGADRARSLWIMGIIAGGVITGGIYGYSFIDGIIVNNEIYSRIYGENRQ